MRKVVALSGFLGLAIASMLGLAARAATLEEVSLTFKPYVRSGFPEQDMYVLSETDKTMVVRLKPDDANFNSRLETGAYAAASSVPHDPYMKGTNPLGPYPAGKQFSLSMSKWLSARGTGTYTLSDDLKGTIKLNLQNLIPNGLYTVMCSRMSPLPLGTVSEGTCVAADGSESSFKADATGKASYTLALKDALTDSSKETKTVIGVVYHSDDKTCGGGLCALGLNSHVQLIAELPTPHQMTKAECLAAALTKKNADLRQARTTLLNAQKDARKAFLDAGTALRTAYNDAVKKAQEDRRVALAKARTDRAAALATAKTAYADAVKAATTEADREIARENRAAALDKAASDYELAVDKATTDFHAAMNKALSDRNAARDRAQTQWDAAKDKAMTDSHTAKAQAMATFHESRLACMRNAQAAKGQTR